MKPYSAGNAVSYSSGAICAHVPQGVEGNCFRKQTLHKEPETRGGESFEVSEMSLAPVFLEAQLHTCHFNCHLSKKFHFLLLAQAGFLSLTNQRVLTNTLALGNNNNCRQRKMDT